MACAICETRRPKRFCPGVRGDICPVCCGTEREVTVDCPLECEFLREARLHDRPAPLDSAGIPNQDIGVSEDFLRENEALLLAMSRTLAGAALDTPGVVDADVREALDSLVRTYRTLQSGLVYDTVPANPYAARVYEIVQAFAAGFRSAEQQRLGMPRTRDSDVLGVLVFLQRIEYDRSNGRRRGRAFIDFLRGFAAPEPGNTPPLSPAPLIVP